MNYIISLFNNFKEPNSSGILSILVFVFLFSNTKENAWKSIIFFIFLTKLIYLHGELIQFDNQQNDFIS